MCKRDEDIDLWSWNVQIQPCKFEPLKSGKDLVRINLSGSQGYLSVTYQQRKNRPNGLVSLSEHVQNYPSKISNEINEYRLSQSGCPVLFCEEEKPIT